ncbi:hypothetical protein NA57DRAFT_70025 [Rhizodiscina lignyota]|uniref:Uncharacterized protein n=1 Tax=Rhizodiscina lignyota TaxID=1504668 RepID=A0A9P4IT72_9PEZI|nr:hypothetical protein NA57DRAFT_70025 [Rhizodiscina lignyota]
MFSSIKQVALLALGLSAVSMAAPAVEDRSRGSSISNPDKILFNVTSVAEASSSVEVPIGGNVVLQENVTAIAVASVIVEQVGRATCTISTAEAESDVTDTILVGWEKVFSTTTSASSFVQSISCTYCEGDRRGHRGSHEWKPKHDRHGENWSGWYKGWSNGWGSRKGGSWGGW